MSSSERHYDDHLGPVYLWMAGGAPAALAAGAAEIDALNLALTEGTVVVDLGAGFGMHALALARRGAQVTAIDSSAAMLRTLEELRGELPVRAVHDDLLGFRRHLTQAPAAILCMGDTITHLPDAAAVDTLVDAAAAALLPGGVFVISLRDYSVPLVGDQRFIPVRSDAQRILTCFLEYETEAVVVHDMLHERTPQGWQTRVSHYRKLRLSPVHLIARLEAAGFVVRPESGANRMLRLVAQRI